MNVEPINPNITFNSRIKRLYKSGKIKLDYDLYGLPLNKNNVTDEHIICRCFGGSSEESNIALATREINNLRGNKPIEQFVTMNMVNKYVERILTNNPHTVDGYDLIKYCSGILRTFRKIFKGERNDFGVQKSNINTTA